MKKKLKKQNKWKPGPVSSLQPCSQCKIVKPETDDRNYISIPLSEDFTTILTAKSWKVEKLSISIRTILSALNDVIVMWLRRVTWLNDLPVNYRESVTTAVYWEWVFPFWCCSVVFFNSLLQISLCFPNIASIASSALYVVNQAHSLC